MPFNVKKSWRDEDSKVRYDVETLAYITMSDVEFLLTKLEGEQDVRVQSIFRESAVNKLASLYQLFMKACKYLKSDSLQSDDSEIKIFAEEIEKVKSVFDIENPKEKDLLEGEKLTAVGKIKKYRDDLFHDGITFLERDVFYPFATIKGKGYAPIRIKKGGKLIIKEVATLEAKDSEFAITSEGIFEIKNPDTEEESWKHMPEVFMLQSSNTCEVDSIIRDALQEHRKVWGVLSQLRKQGIHGDSMEYLNESGQITLVTKSDDKVISTCLNEDSRLVIDGTLTLEPPDKMTIKNRKMSYQLR